MSSLGHLQTGNPAFTMGGTVFDEWARQDVRGTTMTVAGTASKALVFLAICLAGAAYAWREVAMGPSFGGLVMGASIAGLVLALVTVFMPKWAWLTGSLYSAAQGVALGAISRLIDARYPGIALQAVGLTFATTLAMLMLYTTRVVRVTPGFQRFVIAATGALLLVYVLSFVLRLFGVPMPYLHDASPLGLLVSAVAIGLAAMNLLLDFDYIEGQSERGAPKYLEWYAAFGLMVTLVWLYIEILRLLSKLQERR
ncbi:MAG: membrane protein [Isosphaeraceae bacterium]|jgi:uncharacterized YccA/Bax inhibitor family protein|nr:MAG: membrane protein [Isosphaeraceae bacterium]